MWDTWCNTTCCITMEGSTSTTFQVLWHLVWQAIHVRVPTNACTLYHSVHGSSSAMRMQSIGIQCNYTVTCATLHALTQNVVVFRTTCWNDMIGNCLSCSLQRVRMAHYWCSIMTPFQVPFSVWMVHLNCTQYSLAVLCSVCLVTLWLQCTGSSGAMCRSAA